MGFVPAIGTFLKVTFSQLKVTFTVLKVTSTPGQTHQNLSNNLSVTRAYICARIYSCYTYFLSRSSRSSHTQIILLWVWDERDERVIF